MQNNHTKKTVLMTLGVIGIVIISAVIVVAVLAALKGDESKDSSDTQANVGAAKTLIDKLAAAAQADTSLSTITTSAADHEKQVTVVTIDQDIQYAVEGTNSLTFSTEGPLSADARSAITASLDAFFAKESLDKAPTLTTNAALAIYSNASAVCSVSGTDGSPEIQVACQEQDKVSESRATITSLVDKSGVDTSNGTLFALESESSDTNGYSVTIITVSDERNRIIGSLLYTQAGTEAATFVGDTANAPAGGGGGKLSTSDATTQVLNDPNYGPLLRTLIGSEKA